MNPGKGCFEPFEGLAFQVLKTLGCAHARS